MRLRVRLVHAPQLAGVRVALLKGVAVLRDDVRRHVHVAVVVQAVGNGKVYDLVPHVAALLHLVRLRLAQRGVLHSIVGKLLRRDTVPALRGQHASERAEELALTASGAELVDFAHVARDAGHVLHGRNPLLQGGCAWRPVPRRHDQHSGKQPSCYQLRCRPRCIFGHGGGFSGLPQDLEIICTGSWNWNERPTVHKALSRMPTR